MAFLILGTLWGGHSYLSPSLPLSLPLHSSVSIGRMRRHSFRFPRWGEQSWLEDPRSCGPTYLPCPPMGRECPHLLNAPLRHDTGCTAGAEGRATALKSQCWPGHRPSPPACSTGRWACGQQHDWSPKGWASVFLANHTLASRSLLWLVGRKEEASLWLRFKLLP